MNKIFTVLTVFFVGLIAYTPTAMALNAAEPEGSLIDLVRPVYDAVMGGQWWLAASFALILTVAAFKRYAPGRAREWANTDMGGALLVLLMAFGGALSTSLLAGGAVMSLAIAWTALKVAVGAAGGYTLLKKLLAPLIEKLAAKAPSWMQPMFAMLLWLFNKPAAVETAEKAGDDAVAANPATGTDGKLGEPTDFDSEVNK